MANGLRTCLIEFLRADPGVAALVGARVYPDVGSERTGDYIVVHGISRRAHTKLNDTPGKKAGPTGAVTRRIQVDCSSARRLSADAIAAAVRGAKGGVESNRPLEAFAGDLCGITVQACRVADERDQFAADFAGDQQGERAVQLDLMITYLEN